MDDSCKFWQSNDYKYNVLLEGIQENELEDGIPKDFFDLIKADFQHRISEEKGSKSKKSGQSPNDFESYDELSHLILNLSESQNPCLSKRLPFSIQENDSHSNISTYTHKNVDLHGFTQIGARQVVRRVLLNVDRTKKSTIKFNVGKGSHSEKHVLPDIVREVCRSLGYPQPSISPKNQGYLKITIDPSKEEL